MSNERLKRNQRHIIERIVIRGTLILDTPTCLGSGDAEGPTDMMLIRDSISSHALLTGASIAGALRNYVHEHQQGYGKQEPNNSLSASLFGGISKDDDGDQSPLIINDSISSKVPQIELRDGVKINSITRTVDPEARAKYDLELLQAGTEFSLCFELLIEREANKADLRTGLAIALSGLEKGEISLGMKKRRGFGRCHVKEWQVWNFNLEDTSDRTAWLSFEHWQTGLFSEFPHYSSIQEAFAQANIKVDFAQLKKEDQRDRFLIHATFNLVGSLLIRSGQDSTGRAPDVVHLKSHRPDKTDSEPVLSGTSLAGVLRHRAERIVNTLKNTTTIIDENTTTIIDEMFGPDFSKDKTKQAKASRLIVQEKVIKNATDLVQNRIAIDRFTGGAYHGALFDEQPIFGGKNTCVTIEIELRKPEKYEIGLLLLLLKDLWTQDLPVGGESSIGRGRLQGRNATLTWYQWDKEKSLKQEETWTIKQCDPKKPLKFSGSDQDKLQGFVSEFVDYIGKGEKQ
jgi:CRISPR/Cas system CSM-associated protein Csm3 (group 7 of RAMP superfamily)